MKLNNEIRDYIRNHVNEKCCEARKPLEEESKKIRSGIAEKGDEICIALNAVLDSVQPKLNAVCKKYGIENVTPERFNCGYRYTNFTTKRIMEIENKLREIDNESMRLTNELFVRASLGCDYDSLQELLSGVHF